MYYDKTMALNPSKINQCTDVENCKLLAFINNQQIKLFNKPNLNNNKLNKLNYFVKQSN